MLGPLFALAAAAAGLTATADIEAPAMFFGAESKQHVFRAVKLGFDDLLRHQQFPPDPATDCLTRRLLVLRFDAGNFEGLGSTLLTLSEGLAEAAHSNRTLVWGLANPTTADTMKAAWSPETCGPFANGGAYSCLIKPISSCSFLDVSNAEAVALGDDGFDDGARVKLTEERRGGMALYAPPEPWRTQTSGTLDASGRRLWTAAVMRMVARPTDHLGAQFAAEAKRFGLAGGGAAAAADRCDVGLHVRHGELKMRTVYENRPYLPFRLYFDAANAVLQKPTTGARDTPRQTVYVATDDGDVRSLVGAESNAAAARAAAAGGSHKPARYVVPEREREEYGTHFIAGNYGCRNSPGGGSTCALPHTIIQAHNKAEVDAGRVKPPLQKAVHALAIHAEAFADLLHLASCRAVVGTGTSAFSVLASFMATGDGGGRGDSHFLDIDGLVSGEWQPAFYHQQLNATHKLYDLPLRHRRALERLHERGPDAIDHQHLERIAPDLDALQPEEADAAALLPQPFFISPREHLPMVPVGALYAEAARWRFDARDERHVREAVEAIYRAFAPEKLGSVSKVLDKFLGRWPELLNTLREKYGPRTSLEWAEGDPGPHPTECPVQRTSDDWFLEAAKAVNAGAGQYRLWHYHQAHVCWKKAFEYSTGRGSADPKLVESDISGVARTNMLALSEEVMKPYHSVAQFEAAWGTYFQTKQWYDPDGDAARAIVLASEPMKF